MPCEIDQSSTNLTASLDPVNASVFKSVGDTAGEKTFSIKLKNCGSYQGNATLAFSGTAATPESFVFSGITGVALQMLDNSDNSVIVNGTTKQWPINSGAAEYKFRARYVATAEQAKIVGGNGSTTVLFALTYN
ncbi:hypothetical protein WJ96_20445 [Burkholderia ubonensis]|uniref:Fimbrial-type adhesion domain-containing protein n=1 Tax=Burkholderia ubonensis TaxID=101571 RepID=A0AAW3MTX1_9BURK|nr:hypothetical protein WJ45_15920 [Burkholderia ubonensis]KVN83133.1 hypothetical protein WJ67_04510 [Burkholderia ubonensis]KVO39535.1 hypothetical protein WJ75_08475 [Burkholderia ubonensis]KVP89365.1 hypothetical protein WJ96_20445 [Burkholderia ubonensis]KVQ54161.1 hypothetical protein WK04_02665 [Burkholderia ubonensis]